MNSNLIGQFINLACSLLVAVLVVNHYRNRTYLLTKRYSTFWPRFWSGSVDSCILWPVGFISFMVFSLNPPRIVAAILVIVESLTWLLYTVLMHARNGQTIGKMYTKVRVVDYRTEGKISLRQAWLREGIPMVLSLGLVGYEVFAIMTGSMSTKSVAEGKALTDGPYWLLMGFPFLWFAAEVLTMLTNEKRRALHDFIAGTVVVRLSAQDATTMTEGPVNGSQSIRPA
jgi:uncharacterized RDD family membrane protein YckC